MSLGPAPVVAPNRAVALAEVEEAEAALVVVECLQTGCVVPDVEAGRRSGERSVRGLVLGERDQRLVPRAAIRAVLEVQGQIR
jgi:predicted RNA polymerase sigma factor